MEPLTETSNQTSPSSRKYQIFTGDGDNRSSTRDLEKLYQLVDSVLAHILRSDNPSITSIYSKTLTEACRRKYAVYCYFLSLQPPTGRIFLSDAEIRDYFQTSPPDVRIMDMVKYFEDEDRCHGGHATVRWGAVHFESSWHPLVEQTPDERNELWLSKDLIDSFLAAPANSDLEVQYKIIIVATLFREYTHCLLKKVFKSRFLMMFCDADDLYNKLGEVRLEVENLIFGFSLLADLPLNDDHPLQNIAKLIARVNEADDYEFDVNQQHQILNSLSLGKIAQVKPVQASTSVSVNCIRVRGLAYIPRDEGEDQANLPSPYDPGSEEYERKYGPYIR